MDFIFICVCEYEYVEVFVGAQRGWKKVLDPRSWSYRWF